MLSCAASGSYHFGMRKPYAESCDQNREPILAVLREVLADCGDVLEVGSGTGQHAVYFARHLSGLTWHTSDLPECHPGIRAWLQEAGLSNVRGPLALDVRDTLWPLDAVDVVFSANTTHIMSWPAVASLFQGAARVLPGGGLLCLYGPFAQDGQHTSPGNARFDAWLRSRDPDSGVRDLKDLDRLADEYGLHRAASYPMPTDNRIVVWRRAG